MKFFLRQENLHKGLNIVGRAVATRTTLPITQNVLLETDESRLKLSATNLEIAISTWITGRVEAPGSITVPARLLTEFVSSLPSENIEIEVSQRPRGLHLKCARVEAHINGTDAGEFPPIPKVEEGVRVKIDPAKLNSAIGQVVFAAATEDSRPVLTGVKVELGEGKYTLAAADGFRLAVHSGALDGGVSESTSCIIPSKTLMELSRLLSDQKEPVEMVIASAKSQVLFRLKNVEIVSQLIQGSFPNYSQLIPKEHATRAVIPLQDFLRAAKTASIFARDGSGIIRLHITPTPGKGKVMVVSKAEEVGEDQGELDAKVEGAEAKIAFNSKYLLDVLGAVDKEEVSLDVSTASSPGVFRPAGSESYTHVVMPMFVQW